VPAGIWRLTWVDPDNIATVWLNLAWTIYNLMILGACVAAANETRQLRGAHRITLQIPATLYLEDGRSLQLQHPTSRPAASGVELPQTCRSTQDAQLEVALYRETRSRASLHRALQPRQAPGPGLRAAELRAGTRVGAMHHRARRHLGGALGQPPPRRSAPRDRPHRAASARSASRTCSATTTVQPPPKAKEST
jgi:hypothetical protein